MYSGGDERRRGVAIIMKGKEANAIKHYTLRSERCMCMRVGTHPVNTLLVQVYAPTSQHTEEEMEEFYSEVKDVVKENKEYGDIVIIMGDYNAKVGEERHEDIVGPHGLGERNDRGEDLIGFCKEQGMVIMNTWFEQKRSARYTWTSPNGEIRNQIDFVLVNQRYRNSITNAKSRPGADCGSDHNPVVFKVRVKLKVPKKKSSQRYKYNCEKLKNSAIKGTFKEATNQVAKEIKAVMNEETGCDEVWVKLRDGTHRVAKEVCGETNIEKKKKWMTDEILDRMNERKLHQRRTDEYRRLNGEIQRMCREAKEQDTNNKCDLIEKYQQEKDPRIYAAIKGMTTKQHKVELGVKSKEGVMIRDKDKLVERWKEYVEELYYDERLDMPEIATTRTKVKISEEEVRDIIRKLPKNKAAGVDGITAELIQNMGEECINLITWMVNKIYKGEDLPSDFIESIFIVMPKTSNASECGEFRTLSLIAHIAKVILQIIKKRIGPVIERQLDDSQLGFRAKRGTIEAVTQLHILGERMMEKQKSLYVCFIDYTKAFDRIKHHKLIQILLDKGIPKEEIKIIGNLYWSQKAKVRIGDQYTEEFEVKKGVRQGCILSPILFNIYSEELINYALESYNGVKVNGVSYTNIRFADDTAVIAETEEELQNMMTSIVNTCDEYGMELNAKKTKTMVVTKSKDNVCKIKVKGKDLEQVKKFRYLGTMISEDGKSLVEVKRRIAIAKDAFWKYGELLRNNISIKTKKKILQCYINSVFMYGCESWTITEEIRRRIEAFEMWCYRRMLKIKWTDRVTNEEVLRRAGVSEKQLFTIVCRRKLKFAGHVIRGSSGEMCKNIIEGTIEGKRSRGRQRMKWMDNIKDWMGEGSYGMVKRRMQDKKAYRSWSTTFRG